MQECFHCCACRHLISLVPFPHHQKGRTARDCDCDPSPPLLLLLLFLLLFDATAKRIQMQHLQPINRPTDRPTDRHPLLLRLLGHFKPNNDKLRRITLLTILSHGTDHTNPVPAAAVVRVLLPQQFATSTIHSSTLHAGQHP